MCWLNCQHLTMVLKTVYAFNDAHQNLILFFLFIWFFSFVFFILCVCVVVSCIRWTMHKFDSCEHSHFDCLFICRNGYLYDFIRFVTSHWTSMSSPNRRHNKYSAQLKSKMIMISKFLYWSRQNCLLWQTVFLFCGLDDNIHLTWRHNCVRSHTNSYNTLNVYNLRIASNRYEILHHNYSSYFLFVSDNSIL